MIKILANDGIDAIAKEMLEKAGYQVDTTTIPQDELSARLNDYDALVVRSATKVRQSLIDACPNLKVIVRAGVGMDNIDVEYARSVGKTVLNTPLASSQSVAELVFAHMFTLARFLHQSNRDMPIKGNTDFNKLKRTTPQGLSCVAKPWALLGLALSANR